MDAAELQAVVDAFVQTHADTADQMLPVLHHLQQQCGCVPAAALQVVAEALNVSVAEVHGVVSFYTDFQMEASPLQVDVCCAEACQASGARRLYDELTASTAPQLSVRRVYCLGNCAAGPSVRVGDSVLARADVGAVQRELGKT